VSHYVVGGSVPFNTRQSPAHATCKSSVRPSANSISCSGAVAEITSSHPSQAFPVTPGGLIPGAPVITRPCSHCGYVVRMPITRTERRDTPPTPPSDRARLVPSVREADRLVFPDLEGKVKRRAVDLQSAPRSYYGRVPPGLDGHRQCVVYQRDERAIRGLRDVRVRRVRAPAKVLTPPALGSPPESRASPQSSAARG
jgi:hypothetical protein